jgi:hypothetical protein
MKIAWIQSSYCLLTALARPIERRTSQSLQLLTFVNKKGIRADVLQTLSITPILTPSHALEEHLERLGALGESGQRLHVIVNQLRRPKLGDKLHP